MTKFCHRLEMQVLATILPNHWEPLVAYKYPYFNHYNREKQEKDFWKKSPWIYIQIWTIFITTKRRSVLQSVFFFVPALKRGHHGGMKLNTLVASVCRVFFKKHWNDCEASWENFIMVTFFEWQLKQNC